MFIHDMQDVDIYQPLISRRIVRHVVRGVEFAVHEWGDSEKPLVFYLHGWGDCGPTFQFVVDRLRSDWHVVAPDMRGFGDSTAAVTGYWFPDYLADLHALLDLYSRDEPVRLVGHSMGGNIVGLYAAAMPERVSAFVNLEGFGLPDSDPRTAPDHYRRWLEAGARPAAFTSYESFHALALRIRKRNPPMTPQQAEFVARCWARRRGARVVLKVDPLHKLPNPVLYRRAEAEACWERVQAPTLLVVGSDSDIARQVGPRSAAAVKLPFANATRLDIPASGHMLHFDAPGAIAAAIEAFLGRHVG